MVTAMYINLAVKDLEASKRFFEAIGFHIYNEMTDPTAACVQFGPNMNAMLLTEAKLKEFTSKGLCDMTTTLEQMTAFAVESREEVDSFMEKALANGGSEPRPAQDYGFMYGRDFEDLDGHTWEVFYMDEAAAKETFENKEKA